MSTKITTSTTITKNDPHGSFFVVFVTFVTFVKWPWAVSVISA
jgi:hypothetical protein